MRVSPGWCYSEYYKPGAWLFNNTMRLKLIRYVHDIFVCYYLFCVKCPHTSQHFAVLMPFSKVHETPHFIKYFNDIDFHYSERCGANPMVK